jgi:halimadienyl-diphosphate synthase
MVTDNQFNHITELLSNLGTADITSSPYDTAWMARLGEMDRDLSSQALDWLRANQLKDGSWGSPYLTYYHERLISTLGALVALARLGHAEDRKRINRASAALHGLEECLGADGAGATVGFEMLVPALIEEAEALGVYQRSGSGVLAELSAQRAKKLAKLPDGRVNRELSVAFSAEMLGQKGLHALDLNNIQEPNGSIAYSPSATAFYAMYVRPGDPDALRYLRDVAVQGTVPTAAPIDVFEVGWALWNTSLTGVLQRMPLTLALCQAGLDFLEDAWIPGRGVSYCAGWMRADGDTSGLVAEVLARFGRDADMKAILGFEADDGFECYPMESNRSISGNIHILGALAATGFDVDSVPVQKVLGLLHRTRTAQGYWYDKWHASPFYPTAHGIIAMLDYAPDLVTDALAWIISVQHPDGSWGYFVPTAEETSYAIQALVMAQQRGFDIPVGAVRRGAVWLNEHTSDPTVPLWIGKSLYTPIKVVESTVLSATLLADQV